MKGIRKDHLSIAKVVKGRFVEAKKGLQIAPLADVVVVTKGFPDVPLAEGVGHRTLGTFRRKYLPGCIDDTIAAYAEKNADEADFIVDVEKNDVGIISRSYKRKTHNNNRSSTVAKRSRLKVDLVATTADPSTHGLDSTEAVG
ncbi:hypothetical protein V6N13_020003 [Hibiscus sabdariffa]|uniref:Uncharacterized protein n=1 Tax=Hibiscus sabdariffa TaxID=183260 RepID=A0ABR2ES62_9ROSI